VRLVLPEDPKSPPPAFKVLKIRNPELPVPLPLGSSNWRALAEASREMSVVIPSRPETLLMASEDMAVRAKVAEGPTVMSRKEQSSPISIFWIAENLTRLSLSGFIDRATRKTGNTDENTDGSGREGFEWTA
jgi:hypothetical protein